MKISLCLGAAIPGDANSRCKLSTRTNMYPAQLQNNPGASIGSGLLALYIRSNQLVEIPGAYTCSCCYLYVRNDRMRSRHGNLLNFCVWTEVSVVTTTTGWLWRAFVRCLVREARRRNQTMKCPLREVYSTRHLLRVLGRKMRKETPKVLYIHEPSPYLAGTTASNQNMLHRTIHDVQQCNRGG